MQKSKSRNEAPPKPLRVFGSPVATDDEQNVPGPGELVLGRDRGGARHFLDGKPVHCGTELELLVDRPGDVWRVARYEASLFGIDPPAHLYVYSSDLEEVVQKRDATPADRFRWPAKRSDQ